LEGGKLEGEEAGEDGREEGSQIRGGGEEVGIEEGGREGRRVLQSGWKGKEWRRERKRYPALFRTCRREGGREGGCEWV